jgi:hypothetical protein
MAWVGLINSQTHLLEVQAGFGDDAGYLKDLVIAVEDCGPSELSHVIQAIHERQPVSVDLAHVLIHRFLTSNANYSVDHLA